MKSFQIGDRVKCVYGRFIGCEGIVIEYDMGYGKFCMRVDSCDSERVNPDNWVLV